MSRDEDPASPVHVVNDSLELGAGGEGRGKPAEDLSLHTFIPDLFFPQSQTFHQQQVSDRLLMDFCLVKIHLLLFQGEIADPGVAVFIISDDLK